MSFLPGNADRIYVNALGGAAAVSIAHYLVTFTSVNGSVPVHFNIYGQPDSFVGKHYYIFYPVMTAAACALGYAMSDKGSIKVRPRDQPATCGIMLCSVALAVASQVYAYRIANGTASKLPTAVLALGFFGIGSCAVYSLLNGIANT